MMTWAKLSDDFGDECARAGLSDAAFRLHVEGLVWTMRRETGGYIDQRDISRFAETANPALALAELLAVGFWLKDGTGYRLVRHMEHQPEPDLIAARRKKTTERVRRHRRRQAGLED
jgi:hypothetical protein